MLSALVQRLKPIMLSAGRWRQRSWHTLFSVPA
jgi:hypothetical protein